MIPMRFAIEMVNRGWILRNVIIWHKSNCMPSSVKDRFTVDFEYLLSVQVLRKGFFFVLSISAFRDCPNRSTVSFPARQRLPKTMRRFFFANSYKSLNCCLRKSFCFEKSISIFEISFVCFVINSCYGRNKFSTFTSSFCNFSESIFGTKSTEFRSKRIGKGTSTLLK